MAHSQPETSRIVHLSDLHFGRTDPTVVDALHGDIAKLAPELVIVSGDLTMRARQSEFRAARAFLDQLPCRWMSVPGNHDLPYYNVIQRLFSPFRRYRQFISEDLMPRMESERFAVLGLNTARPIGYRTFDWSRGRISLWQIVALQRWFSKIPETKPKIVFAHHPFILPDSDRSRGVVGRLRKAVAGFTLSNVDLLLAGHLHQAFWSKLAPTSSGSSPILAVQASTATSTRLKGEPNAYNVIETRTGFIRITRRVWSEREFREDQAVTHQRPVPAKDAA